MKKFLSIVLCAAALVSLFACGSDTQTVAESSNYSSVSGTNSSDNGDTSHSGSVSSDNDITDSSIDSSADSSSPSVSSSSLGSAASSVSPSSAVSGSSSSRPSGSSASSTGSSSKTGTTSSSQSSSTTSSPTKPPADKPETVNIYGNDGFNIYSGGFVAGQGNWVYYANPSDNNYLYKMRTDGTQKQRLISVSVSHSINVVGDWVYFFRVRDDIKAPSYLYRVKTDGTVYHKVAISGSGNDCYVTGGYVYSYCYRIPIDFTSDTERETISSFAKNMKTSPTFYKNEIVFLAGNKSFIWHSSLSDYNPKNLCDDPTSSMTYRQVPVVTEKYIVSGLENAVSFITKDTEDIVYRFDIFGSSFFVENDRYLYGNRKGSLVRYDIVTNEKIDYNVSVNNGINVVGDYIYYKYYDKLYRIKKDGTGNEAV